jgi:RNA polymerase sigma-70 factor, ECF subfamily
MPETPEFAGDRYERFVALLARHGAAVRTYLRCLLSSWQDVEEVNQETCLVLWKKFDRFDPASDFRAWAFTIARLEALKYRRRVVRDRLVFREELLALLADEEADEADRRERERQALDRCVESLPPARRQLIRAADAVGGTIREVAADAGRSATGLYKALNRLRLSLLECVRRRMAEGDLA